MISKIKKPVSILLSLIMVFSVFAIVPLSASAAYWYSDLARGTLIRPGDTFSFEDIGSFKFADYNDPTIIHEVKGSDFSYNQATLSVTDGYYSFGSTKLLPTSVSPGGLLIADYDSTTKMATFGVQNITHSFDETTGTLTIGGSGVVTPNYAFTGSDVYDVVFTQSNLVKHLIIDATDMIAIKQDAFMAYTGGCVLEDVEINSTSSTPLIIEENAVFYESDNTVTITVNAVKLATVTNSPVNNYGSPVNLIYNVEQPITFEKNALTEPWGDLTVTFPAGCKIFIPGGPQFTDSELQDEYDMLAEHGDDEFFWRRHSDLVEGTDYVLGDARYEELTPLNASLVVGNDNTALFSAYTITDESVNGTVTASVNGTDVTEAAADADVLLTVAPDNGYQFKSISATYPKNKVEEFSDLVALMGDAVFSAADYADHPEYTCKVNDGKFVVYDGDTSVAELSEANMTNAELDGTYFSAQCGGLGWNFYFSDGRITDIYVYDSDYNYIFPSAGGSKSTGTLLPVVVNLTTVTEGSQYSLTMPKMPVTVTAEFEEAPTPTYTVTWKNGDTVIEEDTDVESGAAPTFNGTTPEKAEDETNTYTFSGWSDGNTTYGLSDTLPNVTADVTYTAQFTAVPKHTHVMTAHEAVAATCTTAGTSAYWECTDCGKFFSDADGNSEIDDIDAWLAEGGAGYVAATGHNKTHYAAQAATFDAPGNIEYWYCDRCEKYFSDENCENEITQAQTVTPVRAHEILSDADFAYAAANGGTDWYLKADVNADGVTIASNLKIWNTDKTHTISGDITIADGCEFAVAGKKTTNLTGKVTLAGQDSKATSLRTPEIILTQPYKSGQVYGSPASTIITYNGRQIIYNDVSLTAAAKNGGEYYVVDDIAISGATTVKADLTITGLKEDGSTPVITVSAPTSAKPFCLFNLSSGVDITIENVDFAATLSNTKTVGVVSADLNSSAASYNTVTITDSEISGFSVSDGYGAVYLHGYTQAVLTNVEMSGNGKYDVWAGSEATVTINGGSYETIFLHSYSGTGAVLDSTDATIGELELDNTITTRLNATINSGTVTTITESGDGDPLPAEVVVYDPANATVGAPAGYKWVDSEEAGMKTLVPDTEVPFIGPPEIIGYQRKIVKTEQSTADTGNGIGTKGVRIVTQIDQAWLEANADDYGYVVAKYTGAKTQSELNFANLTAFGGNGQKTISCKNTYNEGVGYGDGYVTLAVNGMTDNDKVVARFYYVKDGVTYYANYSTYSGILATY